SSRRRHTRSKRDWSSDVCSSDLPFFCRPTRNIFRLYSSLSRTGCQYVFILDGWDSLITALPSRTRTYCLDAPPIIRQRTITPDGKESRFSLGHLPFATII